MNAPTPELAGVRVSQPDRGLTGIQLRKAQRIGAATMTQPQIDAEFASLVGQLTNGIQGKENDRLLAIRTRTPRIPAAALDNVQSGTTTFVEEFGGESLKLSIARKEPSGDITVSEPVFSTKYRRDQRQLTFDGLISRITDPIIAKAHLLEGQPVRAAFSVGQPQENRRTRDGMTVELKPKVTEDGAGVLVKEMVIEDWASVPKDQREITQAVRRRLGASLPNLSIGTVLGANDTVAVRTNRLAVAKAEAKGLKVLETGGVGGTGTNDAFFLEHGYHPLFDLYVPKADEGYVNMEIGHGVVADNAVSKRVRQRLVALGEMKQEEAYPQPEHELGQYLPLRLAAAVELFAENGDLEIGNPTEFAESMIAQSQDRPAFMSDVATNQIRFSSDAKINSTIQALAQEAMIRAGQMYGILKAVAAEPVQEPKTPYDQPDASLNEGSMLLLGKVDDKLSVRKVAENTSTVLGHPISIEDSSGLTGVAQLAMAYEHLEDVA